jgi:hypothetical protein
MTTYTNPYTGATINPAQVGYESLTISSNTTLQWPVNGTPTNNAVVANIIEVTATANSLLLILPPATQISVGQAFIVRNVGTGGNYSFTVTDNNSTTIVNIPLAATATVANTYYIYCTNNSTTAGTWASIAMGIGTSSATAGALAGSGLTAIANTLNENTVVSTFSSTYTFNANDRAILYVWTGGSGTVTLPTVASVGAGWFVMVKNNGTGILTVASQSPSIIDGVAGQYSVQIQTAYSSAFMTDGTNWFTYALTQLNTFQYTQFFITVAGLGSAYTLSAANARNTIQTFTGALTTNLTVTLPPTVQIYAIRNSTSGSYNLTFTTGVSGGATFTLPQGQTALLICDGQNIYNANTAPASSTITTLTLAAGSAAAPSLNFVGDTTTGLYDIASGQLGISLNGVLAAQFTSSGLLLPIGIVGGAF